MSKSTLTYAVQLDLLKSRGLTVNDDSHALHCLANYNYYRLSIYWRCFAEKENHDRFQAGTTFEQIWSLYNFDRELRKLVNEACKRLEISARSRWAYELGLEYGPQAYEDPAVFNNAPNHTKLLASFDAHFAQSKEDFALHYKSKHQHRPEIWIAVELFDFGRLRNFYNATKKANLRKRIADHYELPEATFASLLTVCNYMRNICAHHSRLWNRKLIYKLKLPEKKPASLIPNLRHFLDEDEIESRKIYNSLVMLSHLTHVIEPQGDWTQRLISLLKTLPIELIPHMGFPTDWQTRDWTL
jgi:abortive infection bacteriophage resistance protein